MVLSFCLSGLSVCSSACRLERLLAEHRCGCSAASTTDRFILMNVLGTVYGRGHYKAQEATVMWLYVSYARQKETDKNNHAGHGGWGPT